MLTIESRLGTMHRVGKALCDPTRARILLELMDHPDYPAELSRRLSIGRSNVSNHLACLRGCGIVVAVSEGRRTRYELADPHLARALHELVGVALAVDTDGCAVDLDEPAAAARGARA
jgi:DNA-binding transcriptional ArsR family regulator